MNENNNTSSHADQEMLSRYVLDRMSPAERDLFEQHLRTCPQCLLAVEEETLLAAGVRRLGRTELRKRLAQNIAQAPALALPWLRIAAAAAVLLIVGGIGFFGNWFGAGSGRSDRLSETISDGQASSSPQKSERAAAPSLAAPENTVSSRTDETAQSTDRMTQPLTQDDRREKLVTPLPVQPESGVKRKGRLPEPGRENEIAPGSEASGIAETRTAGIRRTQIWTAGMIEEIGKHRAAEVRKDIPDKPQERGEADRVAARQEPGTLKQMGYVQGLDGRRPVILNQRPASALPPAQQALHFQSLRPQVQTLIEESKDTLRMILYLDPPLTAQAFGEARVEQITDDSLVVRFPGLTIGYALPPGLRQSRIAK